MIVFVYDLVLGRSVCSKFIQLRIKYFVLQLSAALIDSIVAAHLFWLAAALRIA